MTLVLAHGTRINNLTSIFKDGLRPAKDLERGFWNRNWNRPDPDLGDCLVSCPDYIYFHIYSLENPRLPSQYTYGNIFLFLNNSWLKNHAFQFKVSPTEIFNQDQNYFLNSMNIQRTFDRKKFFKEINSYKEEHYMNFGPEHTITYSDQEVISLESIPPMAFEGLIALKDTNEITDLNYIIPKHMKIIIAEYYNNLASSGQSVQIASG